MDWNEVDRDVSDPIPYPQNSKFWGSRFINKIFDRADALNDGVDATQASPLTQAFRGAAGIAGAARRIIAVAARTWFIARPTNADLIQRGLQVAAIPAGDTRSRAASIFLSDDESVPRSVAFPIFSFASPRQRADGSFVVDPPVDLGTDSPIATQYLIPDTITDVDVWDTFVAVPAWAGSGDPIRSERVTRIVVAPRSAPVNVAVAFAPSGSVPFIAVAQQTPSLAAIVVNVEDNRVVFTVTPESGRYVQFLIPPLTATNTLRIIEIQAA